MKYEIRSLKGYIAKIFLTNTNKKWKGLGKRGEAKDIVRNIVSLKF